MPRIQPGPPCGVCSKPSIARNLCSTHYSRWRLHGHLEPTRPSDWGQKNKHPLWQSWKQTRRLKVGRCPEWEDFWQFVADVGERPEDSRLLRSDNSKPWGPDNAYWSEPLQFDTASLSKRERAAAAQRAWRAQNMQRALGYEFKSKYGITVADFDRMLEDQGGACAICRGKDDHFRLAVDHCHESGKVRGLLCSKCNRGLGLFCDEPERLEAAASYLRRPRD